LRTLRSLAPSTVLGVVLVGAAVIAAVFGQFFAPHDPFAFVGEPFQPPGPEFVFGTDQLGRDVASRVIMGARASMLFALGAATISLVVGVILGGVAGYFGGMLDSFLSRVFELFLMLPMMVLLIVVMSIFGRSMLFAVVIVGITTWPSHARLARAQALALRERGYVVSSRGFGASSMWALFRHVLPNGKGPIIANALLQMAAAALIEGGLSFLGLGDPNQVSWGLMIAEARPYIQSMTWMLAFPGAALTLFVLGFHLLGEAIEQRPKRRRRMTADV
jgi:peptide/nickel transport system permease protein